MFSLPTEDDTGTSFFFGQISVDRYLSTLDVQKSTGLDGLFPRFLKKIAPEIAVPLTHHCNQSLHQGITLGA